MPAATAKTEPEANTPISAPKTPETDLGQGLTGFPLISDLRERVAAHIARIADHPYRRISWADFALCAQLSLHESEIFFPGPGVPGKKTNFAISICQSCESKA